MYAGQRIGGAWSARYHANAGLAGKLAMCVRHHGGAAFLTADRHLYGRIVQAVEHGQVAFAGYAKHMLDALRNKLIDKNVAAQTGAKFGV